MVARLEYVSIWINNWMKVFTSIPKGLKSKKNNAISFCNPETSKAIFKIQKYLGKKFFFFGK
jgi:hypothetical protein